MAFVDSLLNPVFGWMLNIPPILALLILSVILGLVNTLLQKVLTNQSKMRRLKEDTKKYQAQLKEAQKKKDIDKMQSIQQKMMPAQMEMMKESFKPLFVTMLPFLVIFFWLSSHFAFHPILPGQEFTVTAGYQEEISGTATLTSPTLVIKGEPAQAIANGQTDWTLSGSAGTHDLTLSFAGANITRQVLITDSPAYIQPKMPLKGSVTRFDVGNEKLLPVPGLNIFGWHPGWIFWYILFSIPVSLGLKKVLKVV